MRSEKQRAHSKMKERKQKPESSVIATATDQNIKRKRRAITILAPQDYEDVSVVVRLKGMSGFCECVVDIETDDRVDATRFRIDKTFQRFSLNPIKEGSVVFVSIDTTEEIDLAFVTLTGK